MCHTLKIFERILKARLHDVIVLSSRQHGFVKEVNTTDAIHTIRIIAEKRKEKHKKPDVAFLDLEKAFDIAPCEVVWWALRKHIVPEEYVNVVNIYIIKQRMGSGRPKQEIRQKH